MGIGALVLVLLMGLLLAGLWLLVAGIRGERVPPHTVCGACGFDLSGLEAAVCPECGRGLATPKAVRVIRRRRNSRRALTGTALIVVSLMVPASVLIDSAMSGRLSSVLPTFVLTFEMRALGACTPKSVCDELFARCVKGEVSDSTLRVVATAIADMRSGDESLTPSLNLLVGDAATKGLISKNVLARHAVVPRVLEATVPERVHEGDPVILSIINYGDQRRWPSDGVWILTRRIVAVEVDGKITPSAPATGPAGSRWINAYWCTPTISTGVMWPGAPDPLAVPAQPALAPGVHTVKLHFCIQVFRGRGDAAPGVTNATRDFTVRVLPRGEPLVRQVEDDDFKKSIAATVRPFIHRAPNVPGASDSWSFGQTGKASARPTSIDPALMIGGAWDMRIEFKGGVLKPAQSSSTGQASPRRFTRGTTR